MNFRSKSSEIDDKETIGDLEDTAGKQPNNANKMVIWCAEMEKMEKKP